MKLLRKKALLATLLGVSLSATITCDPGYFDGVISIVDEGPIVVADGCGDCWFGDCCGGGFSFDFFHHDWD